MIDIWQSAGAAQQGIHQVNLRDRRLHVSYVTGFVFFYVDRALDTNDACQIFNRRSDRTLNKICKLIWTLPSIDAVINHRLL